MTENRNTESKPLSLFYGILIVSFNIAVALVVIAVVWAVFTTNISYYRPHMFVGFLLMLLISELIKPKHEQGTIDKFLEIASIAFKVIGILLMFIFFIIQFFVNPNIW